MVKDVPPLRLTVAALPEAVKLPEITAVIDSCFDPLIPDWVAEIVVCPTASPVARPVPLTLATVVVDELHVTEFVRVCVLPSLNVPVAVNCFVVPTAMLELMGVTAMDTNVAPDTVSDAVPLTDPDVAVMVAVPVPTPDTIPVASTLATEVGAALHVTDCSNCVLPSSKLPIAVNCNVVPAAMV